MTIYLTNGNVLKDVTRIISKWDSLGRTYFVVTINGQDYNFYPSEIAKIEGG